MKTLAIILSMLCCSCSKEVPPEEANRDLTDSGEITSSTYPDVVQRVLPLFSRIGVDTNPQDFYAMMDEAGVILDDSDFIYGGGDLGESWEGTRLIGDWILYLDYDSLEPRAIWKAQVYKEVGDKEVLVAFPYFYKGQLIAEEKK